MIALTDHCATVIHRRCPSRVFALIGHPCTMTGRCARFATTLLRASYHRYRSHLGPSLRHGARPGSPSGTSTRTAHARTTHARAARPRTAHPLAGRARTVHPLAGRARTGQSWGHARTRRKPERLMAIRILVRLLVPRRLVVVPRSDSWCSGRSRSTAMRDAVGDRIPVRFPSRPAGPGERRPARGPGLGRGRSPCRG